MDTLSRYAWTKKVSNVTTDKIIELLKEVFREQGRIPKRIFHDNGSQFVSNDFQNFLLENNIISSPTAIFHPQANPVERMNRSFTEAIRLELANDPYKQHKWAAKLKDITWKLNTRYNHVLGMSSFEVQFGRQPSNEMALIPKEDEEHKEIKKQAYERSFIRYFQNKKQFDKRATMREFIEGEIVMIKSHQLSSAEKNVSGKLFPPFEVGKILHKKESNAYEVLKTNGKSQKINVKEIKGISNSLQENLKDLFDQ